MIAGAAGCDDKLTTFNSDVDGLSFVDSLTNFSFVYGDSDATEETLMLKVETMGYVSDRTRYITLEQVMVEGKENAVAGVHYVAFDDASLQEQYVIPKGTTTALIPVVLLRDASLETKDVTLMIRIAVNDDFGFSLVNRDVTLIVFTDRLIKPYHWNGGSDYWFGVYGPVKHRWLIETTGEKWDDDYLYNVIGFDADNTDSTDSNIYRNDNWDDGYVNGYLIPLLTQKLAAYNEELGADGPLEEEDGTIVEF